MQFISLSSLFYIIRFCLCAILRRSPGAAVRDRFPRARFDCRGSTFRSRRNPPLTTLPAEGEVLGTAAVKGDMDQTRSRPLLRQAIPMLNALAFSPQSFVQSGTGAAFDGSKFQQTTWLWRKWNACDCSKLRFKSSCNTQIPIHRPSYSSQCRYSFQNASSLQRTRYTSFFWCPENG